MEAVLLDEIIEQAAKLTADERQKLIRALQEQESEPNTNGGKKVVQPNIEWLKKHRSEYAGNYVALRDGKLVAFARTIKEADLQAKAKGVKNSLLHYIPAVGEEVWGGW